MSYTELHKKYMNTFYNKHKDEYRACEICKVHINRFNFSHHEKSNKHITNLEKQKRIDDNKDIYEHRIELLNNMNLDEKSYFLIKQILE